jgi:hypothetical protein
MAATVVPATAIRSEEPTAWYEHWWVWTIAGVVVLGGAAAVTAAVVTSNGSSSPELVGGSATLNIQPMFRGGRP